MQLAKARLNWAEKRIDEFINACDVFLKEEPYRIIPQVQFKDKREVKIHLMMQVRKKPVHDLRFRAGDAIHNLRAVVDNLISGLAQIKGGSNRLGLEFWESHTNFTDKYLPRIAVLPDEIKDWIASEQPFCRTNGKSILHVLNLLWNEDKHRAPVLMGAAFPSMPTIVVSSTGRMHLEIVRQGGLEDGDTVAKVTIPIEKEMDFAPKSEIDVAFSKRSSTNGAVARTWLIGTHKYILEEVIPRFEPFFR